MLLDPGDRKLAELIGEIMRIASSGEEGILLLSRWTSELEGQLEQIVADVVAESLNAPGPGVVWSPEIRAKYVQFLKNKRRPAGDEHIRNCLAYLDRFMPPEGITTPEQVFDMFASCPETMRHHLDRAFRNLLNFYERVLGYPKGFIARLREAIPSVRPRVDKWIPPEELVIKSMRELEEMKTKYAVFWHAVLDSGARPIHLARELFEKFRPERLEEVNGFWKYRLGVEHETKNAWIAYLTDFTVQRIMELHERGERITWNGVKCWFRRHTTGMYERPDGKPVPLPLRPKLVRKFAYNMMRRCGLDRDIAMWLNGRKPQGVDPEHYLDLERLADKQYSRYAAYLDKLRNALAARK